MFFRSLKSILASGQGQQTEAEDGERRGEESSRGEAQDARAGDETLALSTFHGVAERGHLDTNWELGRKERYSHVMRIT